MPRERKLRRIRRSKKTRRTRRLRLGKLRTTRKIRLQKGGEAHIPPEYFPVGSIINVRDADDYESPFFVTDLATAEREFIGASERPADPYDEPGAISELVAEVNANKSKAQSQNIIKGNNAESARREELQEVQTLNRSSKTTGSRRS